MYFAEFLPLIAVSIQTSTPRPTRRRVQITAQTNGMLQTLSANGPTGEIGVNATNP